MMSLNEVLVRIREDERLLRRLIWLALAAVVVTAVAFGGYYYWDRYIFIGDESPLDLGVQHLEQAIRDDPENVEARVALAQFYYENGAYSEAIAQSQQILAAFPDNQDAQFLLGLAYVQSGQTAVAIEPLSQFVAIRSQTQMAATDTVLETALYFLGTAYLEEAQPAEAIPVLADALTINRTDADAMFQLGQAYALTGQHELAIEQYQNAVRFVPDFTEAYRGMIVSYTALNDSPHVAYARGMEAFSLKDYETAHTHLQNATESLSGFAPAFVGLGLVLEQLGDFPAAAANLEQALALDPNNFMASHALGRIQLLQEQNT